jgi:L-lactate dehydrogenase complex protein LldG
MSGREAVLGKVKRALAVPGDDAERKRMVAMRLERHAANIIPARGQLDLERRVALFCKMAEAVSATVRRRSAPARTP